MLFFELRFRLSGKNPNPDILIYLLGEVGCESFMEKGNELLAYLEADRVEDDSFFKLLSNNQLNDITYLGHKMIPKKNWNAAWESDYDPVLIGNKCQVRAPFHPAKQDVAFDIIIMPRMSFGTAHHETTAMMIELLLEQNVRNMSVLDMGCGTAVLGILAKRMGAVSVLAIDNDEWAYNNAIDNVNLNQLTGIQVVLGDVNQIRSQTFDLILANINRNVLLTDMDKYEGSLKPGGKLLLSGFYSSDLAHVSHAANSLGLELYLSREKNNWIAAVFHKR